MKSVCVLAFLVALVILETDGYSSGAPGSSCWSMRPRHNPYNPQILSFSPFRFSLPSTYVPNEEFEVTISSPDSRSIRGFLLEARDRNNDTVGTFRVSQPATHLVCSNRALTHSLSQRRTSVVGLWRAPSPNVGPVVFSATIVQSYSTFWVGIRSPQVNPRN